MIRNSVFLVLILISTSVLSQTKVVTGNVYAFKDLALKNIQVYSKKADTKVLTDSLGNFSIVCDKKDKLVFKGSGFQSYIKSVKNTENVRIKMVFMQSNHNIDVATGYGHVNHEKLTNSIEHYSEYNNDYCNYTDVFDLIQGKFAGVQVINTGGSKKIQVRGMSTVSADNYAIYIVDGSPVSDIDYIVPTMIKSINVIKDGDATYGARGASGVVLISTF